MLVFDRPKQKRYCQQGSCISARSLKPTKILWRPVDDVLRRDVRQDVEEHAESCQECRLVYHQQQEFQTILQAKPLAKTFIVRVPEYVEQRLRRRIQTALAEGILATSQANPSLWQHLKGGFQTPSFFPRFAFGLATASLLLALVLPQLHKLFFTSSSQLSHPADSADPVEPAANVVTQAVESFRGVRVCHSCRRLSSRRISAARRDNPPRRQSADYHEYI